MAKITRHEPTWMPGRLERLVSPERRPPQYYAYERKFAEWATSNGWEVTKRGWPDFICRRGGVVMAVEVKGGNDDLKPEQIDALDDLSAAGLSVFVWYDQLGLRKWRDKRKAKETVGTLKLEIARLQDLIRGMVVVRDSMLPGDTRRPALVNWSLDDELMTIIDDCRARHERHQRSDSRMTLCSWIYYLKAQGRTFREIGLMVDEHASSVQKMWRGMAANVNRAKHDQYHLANGPEPCDKCGVDPKPALEKYAA